MGTNCDIKVNYIKNNLNTSEAESLIMKNMNIKINDNENKNNFVNDLYYYYNNYFYLILGVFGIILLLLILNYRKNNDENNIYINKLNFDKSIIINNI